MDAQRRRVVVTGAAGATGKALVSRLRDAGAEVVAVDRSVDVTDPGDVTALAGRVAAAGGADGVVHLVGGWKGGDEFPGTTPDETAWLHAQLVTSTQLLTTAFAAQLLQSHDARFAIVSARAVEHPGAGNAAYAAAKAGAEAWTRAFAAAFTAAAGRDGAVRGAAVVLVVDSIGDAPGQTAPGDLADALAALWERPAAEINGARVEVLP